MKTITWRILALSYILALYWTPQISPINTLYLLQIAEIYGFAKENKPKEKTGKGQPTSLISTTIATKLIMIRTYITSYLCSQIRRNYDIILLNSRK